MANATLQAMEPGSGCWCSGEITRVLRGVSTSIVVRVVPCHPNDISEICNQASEESSGRQEKCEALIDICINKIHCGFFWSFEDPYDPATWFDTPFDTENMMATIFTSAFTLAFSEPSDLQENVTEFIRCANLGDSRNILLCWLLPIRERIAYAVSECSTRYRSMESIIELYRHSCYLDEIAPESLSELIDTKISAIEEFLNDPEALVPKVLVEAAEAALKLEEWVIRELGTKESVDWPSHLLNSSTCATPQIRSELLLLQKQIFSLP